MNLPSSTIITLIAEKAMKKKNIDLMHSYFEITSKVKQHDCPIHFQQSVSDPCSSRSAHNVCLFACY